MSTAFSADESFAHRLDEQDPLRAWRDQFEFPSALPGAGAGAGGRQVVYLAGNSLGLMPKAARAAVAQELDDWARLGVEAHFHAKTPWVSFHEVFRESGARLVGAIPGEVVMMNSLTVNLHLMMASFYRPDGQRRKIVIEDAAFPSDSHAMNSQIRWHGLDPADALIRLRPREGEHTIREEDVEALLEREGASIALVMLEGVNYFTGGLLDMKRVAAAARRAGCAVGFDLAHAAGNIPLRLHDWGADFAVWCSYKYLNSGPGAVAGCFVHERHWQPAAGGTIPRLQGWWGHNPATRFRMGPEFDPARGADAWQVSNPPIFSMAPLRASLEIFDRVGIKALREKSLRLTAYLEFLIESRLKGRARIITPREPERRGCQLSVAVEGAGKTTLEALKREGVICDFREPNVIRMAPAPLYNSFHDAWLATRALAEVCGAAR